MNPRILNRAGKLPDDGWYNIEANGEHINHGSKVVLVIDEKARTSIVNRFSAEAAKAGEDFPGQPVDRDHLGKQIENTSEAYGWNMQVRNRGDLLEAKVDWTPIGLPLIEAKPGVPPAYKFFSTEYDPAECEKIGTRIVGKKTYAVVRPLRLDGLSLTNDPNNKGQRPISNRNSSATEEREETKTMKTLLKKMGLAEDASEESAVAAYDTILNRATKAEGQVTTLTTERDTLLTVQVEGDLEKYKNRIKPDNVEKVRKQLIANRASTIELLESLNDADQEGEGGDDRQPITNRRIATPPAGGPGAGSKVIEAAERRAAKIQNRARELRSADKDLTILRSYELAEAEVHAAEAK